MEDKYFIERLMGGNFFEPTRKEIIKTDLTLEEAQAHCKDPETSSSTCTSEWGKALTEKYGVWMDTFRAYKREPDRSINNLKSPLSIYFKR